MSQNDSSSDPLSQDPTRIIPANLSQILRENEALLQQVWERTSDAMALSDAEGIVLAANPSYLSLYGYSHEQIIGKSFAIIFAEEEREQAVARYKVAFASEVTPASYESVVLRADGTERIVEANPTFLTEGGQRTAMLSTIRDITERKRYEQELLRLNETLEVRVQQRTATLQEREVQLRTLAARLTMAEQEERRRISQILHDDLQQLLYALQMHMQLIIDEAKGDENSILAADAGTVVDLLQNAFDVTRQLTVDLSPPLLKREGLVAALPWLVDQMRQMHGLNVDLRISHAFTILNEDSHVLLYQVIRELLFNVRKHAGVDEAIVELEAGEGGELLIHVCDEGCGFEPTSGEAAHTNSFGLFSIQDRVHLFGGQLTIDSAPGQGTRVTIQLPTASS